MRLSITDELGFGFRLFQSNTSPFKGALEVNYTSTNGEVTYGEWGAVTTVAVWRANGNYFGDGVMWWWLEEFSLVESSLPFQNLMSYNHANSPYGIIVNYEAGLYQAKDQDFIFRVDTSQTDIINGNKFRDIVHAGGGDDTVNGMNGGDKLFGNVGHDRLYGGEGDDALYGGVGNDILSGEAGHDLVKGGKGDDILYLSAGNGRLVGGNGSDTFAFRFSGNSLKGAEGRTIIRDFNVEKDLIDLGNLTNISLIQGNRGLVIKGEVYNVPIKALLLDIVQSDLTIDNYVL